MPRAKTSEDLAGAPCGDQHKCRQSTRCPQKFRESPAPEQRPVRYPCVTYECRATGFYAGTDWATSASVPCLASVCAVSAWRMAADLMEREVQRSVHPSVSRQYQRTSWQASPPSATIWSAGKRMPHIQQDLTGARSPHGGTGRC